MYSFHQSWRDLFGGSWSLWSLCPYGCHPEDASSQNQLGKRIAAGTKLVLEIGKGKFISILVFTWNSWFAVLTFRKASGSRDISRLDWQQTLANSAGTTDIIKEKYKPMERTIYGNLVNFAGNSLELVFWVWCLICLCRSKPSWRFMNLSWPMIHDHSILKQITGPSIKFGALKGQSDVFWDTGVGMWAYRVVGTRKVLNVTDEF